MYVISYYQNELGVIDKEEILDEVNLRIVDQILDEDDLNLDGYIDYFEYIVLYKIMIKNLEGYVN